jgi:hypothetical protein
MLPSHEAGRQHAADIVFATAHSSLIRDGDTTKDKHLSRHSFPKSSRRGNFHMTQLGLAALPHIS